MTAKTDLAKVQNMVQERTEELKLLYVRSEKITIQQDESDSIILECEEEIRQLELECRNLEREIPVIRKHRSAGNHKYEELQALKMNLEQTTKQVTRLSSKIGNLWGF